MVPACGDQISKSRADAVFGSSTQAVNAIPVDREHTIKRGEYPLTILENPLLLNPNPYKTPGKEEDGDKRNADTDSNIAQIRQRFRVLWIGYSPWRRSHSRDKC